VAAGRAPETPAAVISRATLPDERVVTGTLATIAQVVAEAALPTPALVVIGDVVDKRVVSVGAVASVADAEASSGTWPLAGGRARVAVR
jgi:siroheme synthase